MKKKCLNGECMAVKVRVSCTTRMWLVNHRPPTLPRQPMRFENCQRGAVENCLRYGVAAGGCNMTETMAGEVSFVVWLDGQ